MSYLFSILHTLDYFFECFVFLPAIYILYYKITAFSKKSSFAKVVFRISIIYVLLYAFRYFCIKFIFTGFYFINH